MGVDGMRVLSQHLRIIKLLTQTNVPSQMYFSLLFQEFVFHLCLKQTAAQLSTETCFLLPPTMAGIAPWTQREDWLAAKRGWETMLPGHVLSSRALILRAESLQESVSRVCGQRGMENKMCYIMYLDCRRALPTLAATNHKHSLCTGSLWKEPPLGLHGPLMPLV